MGDQQSPVNLRDAVRVPGLLAGWEVDWHADRFEPVEEDHGWRFRPCGDHRVRLDGVPFRLVNVHFHRPSEHWVEGERQGAEMHAVHVRAEDVVRLCVVAVFLDLGEPDAATGSAEGPPTRIDLASLVPPGGFHRYEGSLTTGGFTENVSWVVMRTPVPVADESLRAFVTSSADVPRDPQSLNRRFVLTTG